MKNIVRMVLILSLCALPAAAQWDWSMPGSTGVVGDGTASLGLYQFTGSFFAASASAIATVDARYAVTNTVGSATDISPAWTTLKAAVHDQGSGSVTVSLYEVDYCSGAETLICSVESGDTDQDTHCETCTFSSSTFDFANNAYYIHVSINQDSTSFNPRLYELALY